MSVYDLSAVFSLVLIGMSFVIYRLAKRNLFYRRELQKKEEEKKEPMKLIGEEWREPILQLRYKPLRSWAS